MCPPKAACIDEIGLFWTDEELIRCLQRIQNRSPGASLPRNVVDFINPYLYQPSNLPEGSWYVICSKDPKQTKVGFWKAKGDPCQIYSDSSLIGWRTTLEFHEGDSPNGHRTDWVMQEYSIRHKGSSKAEGESSLCRVFRSDREDEALKTDHNQANDVVRGLNNPLHDEDNKSGKAERERSQAMPPDACFASGDFLELLDLVDDPQSSSSSSENSSCVSRSSDVYFDSDALLKEIDCKDEVSQTNPSSYKFSISRPNEMVVSLTAEGSSISGTSKTIESVKAEGSRPILTLERRVHDKDHIPESMTIKPVKVEGSRPILTLERRVHDKDQIPEKAKRRPPPVSSDAGASSSGQKSGADKGKKVDCGKMMKKLFCCIAF